ncbi:MAG: FAD-dependent oxidoreductase, partial [bacterium]|nr:FAD-dependent oxidoreductase [bacterium]
YHLVQRGCRDVVLLERKRLTCGTTWHAAGLIGQLRPSKNLTVLAQYSAELYARLEAETGQATGFSRTGAITIATHAERMEELRRSAAIAECYGVEATEVDAREIQRRWPVANVDDVVGGIVLPGDGHVSPVDVTRALAEGARLGGATICEQTRVTGVLTRAGRAAGVVTDRGQVEADVVVNCGGMWARELGRLAGVNVPLHAAEHFYIITEPIPDLPEALPTLREPDSCIYYKREAGGPLLVGFFEPVALPWGMDGIPSDFEFDELEERWEHIEPLIVRASERIPALRHAGIRQFFNGPESFTPDDRYLLGEAPELPGFFVAAGFNSIGVGSGGGAGRALADWIIDGQPAMELSDVDIRRMMPFQSNANYLHDRTVESLGLLYAMHWPFRQAKTARGARKSPLHDRLAAKGACFGELAGWERANWFAPSGAAAVYQYSFGRQNWFEHSAEEHHAVRKAVGLFDQTSFAKLLLQGPDAEATLQRVCAADIAVAPGKVVYTQWLNERGGIESDLTVTRLDDERYWIVTAPACQVRDTAWLESHIPTDARVQLVDITSGWSVLSV